MFDSFVELAVDIDTTGKVVATVCESLISEIRSMPLLRTLLASLALVIVLPLFSFAEPEPVSNEGLKAVVEPASKIASPRSEEVSVLRAQLKTMNDFTQSLLETVYWSLGSIVVVASLLVGFGWFNSARLHDRDIQGIRNEVGALVSAQGASLRADVEKAVSEGVAQVTAAANSAAQTVVSRTITPLKASVEANAKRLATLNDEFMFEKYRSEARYWEWKDVKANEVTQYLGMLNLALGRNDEFEVSYAMKKLDELVPQVRQLHSSDVTQFVSLIARLSSDYSIQAERIRENLRKVKTY
jgi:hypothetical protein